MSGYCLIAPGHPVHGHYHDHEYGFPQRDEPELFERLVRWKSTRRGSAGKPS
jgi:DNA-3-methyladenine glycosylase I